MKHLIFSLLFFAILVNNKSIAQPGKLDSSFGTKGKVMLKLFADSSNQSIYYVSTPPVAIQDDNKILICISKSYTWLGYQTTLIEIRRFYPDGRTDSSFGNNGIASFPNASCSDSKLRPDGKILLSLRDFGGPLYHIMQLYSNGNIDKSFANNGNTESFYSDGGCPLELLPDNKFLAAAEVFGVKRYTENGFIDSSFGVNGIALANFNISLWGDNTSTIKLQPDNNILAGGKLVYVDNTYASSYAIARFTPEGKIDSSFGINGHVAFPSMHDTFWRQLSDVIDKLDIQSRDEILAGGVLDDGIGQKHSLIRFKSNGVIDSSFAINGKSNIPYQSFNLQSDDKIVVASGSAYNFNSLRISRLLPDGMADKSFGDSSGFSETVFKSLDEVYNQSSAFQATKIVEAGIGYIRDSITYKRKYFLTLARYNNDAVLPVSLLSFNSTKRDNSVLLNWQTANEINNNYFIVERTNNNRNYNWNALATIQEKGNGAKISSYTYEDLHPLQGENYYRLKQVDQDGKFTYSQIAAISFKDGNIIIAYPNPVTNFLNINGLNPLLSNNLEIINSKGTVVKKAITSDANYSWNIESLTKGIYYLSVTQDDKTSSIKFLKK